LAGSLQTAKQAGWTAGGELVEIRLHQDGLLVSACGFGHPHPSVADTAGPVVALTLLAYGLLMYGLSVPVALLLGRTAAPVS
jgi:hypothetical protein